MRDRVAIGDDLRARGIAVLQDREPRPVGGGDISPAWRLATGDGSVFVKTGKADREDMFAAEALGLNALADASAVKVPAVLAAGTAGGSAYLALEWLDLQPASAAAGRVLGDQLASLHRTTSERFGWQRDNTIGATPQRNAWSDDWVAFFAEQRLGFQLRLASDNGFDGELQTLGQRLLERLDVFFDSYRPAASLLHGDLWGGNWAVADDVPVIFDPAVYYGDREADLAMTRLFGGFGREFYAAYEANWPLSSGHAERDALYRLYHVLNHLNLFGGGYCSQAISLMRGLLRR